jgi:hypothetical protein
MCSGGPVKTLGDCRCGPEHRPGHGALERRRGCTAISIKEPRFVIAAQHLSRGRRRITSAVDISRWLRQDTPSCAERMVCHVYGRGRNQAKMISGWPYRVRQGRGGPAPTRIRACTRSLTLLPAGGSQVSDLFRFFPASWKLRTARPPKGLSDPLSGGAPLLWRAPPAADSSRPQIAPAKHWDIPPGGARVTPPVGSHKSARYVIVRPHYGDGDSRRGDLRERPSRRSSGWVVSLPWN